MRTSNDSKSFKDWFWFVWSKAWWAFFIVLALGIFYLGSTDPALLLKSFSVLFAVCGIGTLLYGVRTRRLQEQSQSWLPARGVVLRSEVEIETRTSHRGSHPTTFTFYRPSVTYDYEYQGKKYRSRRIIVANINWPKKEAEEAVARYPADSEVSVWVNPNRPNMAVLERGMVGKSRKYLLVSLVGILFLCIAIACGFSAIFMFR